MLRRHGYRLTRALIRLIVRPRIAGEPPRALPPGTVYVLPQRSLSDLVVLDLVCAGNGWPDPLAGIRLGEWEERRRIVFLNRPEGPLLRHTMRSIPTRLARLLDSPDAGSCDIELLPVQVFWGRTTNRQRSLVGTLFSEDWAATSRLKRFINMLVSRNHIVVDFGEALRLREAAEGDARRRPRRAARILRVRLRQQKVAALGPDFSHRRTLLQQVVGSPAVVAAIEQQVQAAAPGTSPEQRRRKLQAQAGQAATKIASDMSYPTVVALLRLLRAFWRRIYDGIEVHGLERIAALGRTHTLVYLPCHRSHVDYLLLSYLLFQRGLMIPHIAAGENMNMPLVGNLLRRGGAFFMQRSFRGDPIHAALFSEYLYEVYRNGHCVEFFLEGSRTRTGRLLPTRIGLLKMTIAHARRGLPRPLAFVPVYFSYEKLIEAASYLDELRGSKKKRESVLDVLRSLKLVQQNFGHVQINFGKPLYLDDWLAQRQSDQATAQRPDATRAHQASGQRSAAKASAAAVSSGDPEEAREAIALGREILMRINDVASINPVNLAALVILCTPRLAIPEAALARQIDCYLDLLRRHRAHHDYRLTDLDGTDAIAHVTELGLLNREPREFGMVLALQPSTAVMMTWYRNNTAHALALPSLVAGLLEKRRRPLTRAALSRMVDLIFPYLARELHARFAPADTARWAQHLLDAGLLRGDGERLKPPPAQSAEHYRLHLLAGIARPIMERNYIVLGLLPESGNVGLPRAELLEKSQLTARKVARMHGINAPEFFDGRLFDAFIDQLIENGAVVETGSGGLTRTSIVDDVLRGAAGVIDAEYRYAILPD